MQPAWVYKYGGNQLGQRATHAERRADGKIVVFGDMGTSALTLGSITIPAATTSGHFLAVMDSAGVFLQAQRVTSGTTTVRDMCLSLDGAVLITAGGDVTLSAGQLPGVVYSDQMFVMKFNPDLTYAWHRFSTWVDADAEGWAVATDANGNVFCGGTFSANQLVIGEDYVSNYGCYNCWTGDGFVFKLDPNGGFVWMKNIGSNASERVATLTCDSQGDVWVTGSASALTAFNAVFSFDENYKTKGGNTGINMFIAKYDGDDGRCLHGELTQQGFSTGQVYAIDAVLGSDDDVYLAGFASGVISAGENATFSANGDGFLMHIGADYGDRWVRTMGGSSSSEQANSIDFLNGRIAVSGAMLSNQAYVADYPAHLQINGNTAYGFNAVFTENGQVESARVYNAATSGQFNATATVFDEAGQPFLIGGFTSNITFQSTTMSATGGNANIFVLKYVPAPAPTFTMTAGPDKTTLCGVGVQLNGATTPSSITSVGWWPNLGFSFNTSKTPSVNPSKSTAYTMFAYSQGCVLRDTVLVTLSNYNDLTANAGADGGFCIGDSLQLGGSSGNAAAVLTWTPSIALSSTSSANPWVKPNTTTDYLLEAAVGNCKAYDTVRVSANQQPQIYLPVDDLSFGYPRFHLCGTETEAVNMGSSDYTFQLLDATAASNWNNDNLLTLSAAGWLKVLATNAAGCAARDSTLVVYCQNQPPPPIIGSVPTSRSVCEGDSVKVMNTLLTTSVAYSPSNFQFSWYGGWQVDSLDGQGWRDIEFYDIASYDESIYSSGFGNSGYYTNLTIKSVTTSGLKYRAYINDFCSERSYTNVMTVFIGPKVSQQPPISKVICTGQTDSISVNSNALNASYQWQVKSGGVWQNVSPIPGVIVPNGRWLRFFNVQAPMDSLYRCLISGCTQNSTVASDSSIVRVGVTPQVLTQTSSIAVCENQNTLLSVQTNNGPFQYQWYQNNTALNSNTAQYTGFNNDTLSFPNISTSQEIYTYKCRIYNTQCAVEVFSDTVRFDVLEAPNVTWPNAPQNACSNVVALPLTGGNPTGGTYSGAFVTGATFSPSQAGVGAQTLVYTQTYTYPQTTATCTDFAQTLINVLASPTVNFVLPDADVCLGSPNFTLSGGTPSGGTYTSTIPSAVVGNTFQLITLGLGSYPLQYNFTAANGCAASAADTAVVNALPNITWSIGPVVLCTGLAPTDLPLASPFGGQYSGPGLNNNIFDPGAAGPGNHVLTYSYTDLNGCSAQTTQTVQVEGNPPIQWLNADFTYCVNDTMSYALLPMAAGCPEPLDYDGDGVGNIGGEPFFTPSLVGVTGNSVVSATCWSAVGCDTTIYQTFVLETCVNTEDAMWQQIKIGNSDDYVSIETPVPARIVLFNMLGQSVHTDFVEQKATISTSQMPAGVYTLAVYINGRVKTYRVLVW